MGDAMRKSFSRLFGVSLILAGSAPLEVAAQSEVPPDSSVQIIDAQNPPVGFVRPQLAQPQPMTMNDYPAEAFFDAVEGLVALRAVVREDGMIGDIQVVTSSGAPVLDQKAIALTKLRHYTPAVLNGQPVAAWVSVNFDWKIPVGGVTITPSTYTMSLIRGRFVRTTDYPAESVKLGEQGTVRLRFKTTDNGALGDVEILQSSGYPRLDEAAIAKVKMSTLFALQIGAQPRRRPKTTDGRPVTRIREDVTFKLQ
jgi:TonB family protein